jgi:hypothetical protein
MANADELRSRQTTVRRRRQLPLVFGLVFFRRGRGELRAFTSAATSAETVVCCDALVGFREMT